MNWLIDLWIEGSLILAIGLLFYKLTLEKLTFFEWNRGFLIVLLFLSIGLPFLSFEFSNPENALAEFTLPAFEFGQGVATEEVSFGWMDLMLTVYVIGFSIALLKVILGLVKPFFQLQLVEKFSYQGLKIAVHPSFEPASYFGYILLPYFDPEEEDQRQILLHESVHVSKGHSWDLLFTHLFKAVFWFNPLAYLYEKLLREIHEFQADQGVTKSFSQFDYSRLLLRLIVKDQSWQLTNSFNQFQTKKRIIMMNREKSRSTAKSRFLMVIPLVSLMVIVFACDQNLADDESIKPENVVEIQDADGTVQLKEMVNGKLVEISADEIFDVVETQPMPAGGMAGWNEYLKANLKYPAKAKEDGIEGTVIAVFVINTDGSITDVEILRGVGAGLDEEAVRVIQNAPNWEPGKQRGREVRTRMRLPIRFKLS